MHTFISVAAARGNIGDIVIRRSALHLLSELGQRGTVYVGTMPEPYVEGIRIPSGWKTSDNALVFTARMLTSGLVGRAVIVMAPGPATLGSKPAATVKHILLVTFFKLAVRRGSKLIVLGRAVRGSGPALTAEKRLARLASIYLSRDFKTATTLADRVTFGPDFAFLEPVNRNEETYGLRGKVALLSFRHDRPASENAIINLVQGLRQSGFEVKLITQVEEDDANHRRLAEKLAIPVLGWDRGTSHTAQEQKVRLAYGRAAAVISDRLHVLILGAMHGAMPVALVDGDDDKLAPTLDTLLPLQSVRLDEEDRGAVVDITAASYGALENAVRSVHARRQSIRELVAEALAKPSGAPSRTFVWFGRSIAPAASFLLVTASLAWYREGTMVRLKQELGSDLLVVSGDRSPGNDVKLIPDGKLHQVVVRNFFLQGGILWQHVPWGPLCRADTVVLDLNPRVIHVWAALVLRRVMGRRTLVWGHAWPRGGRGSATDRVRRLQRRLADGVITYTETQARDLRIEDPAKPVYAAPNALYSADQMVPSLSDEATRLSVIYVGRLVPEKKPLLLLRAFLTGLIPDEVDLHIVGDGPLLREARALAQSEAMDGRVQFYGHIDDYDFLRDLYSRALCSVSPGYVGLSITQSLAFGVPMVISDDEPHAPEIEAARAGFNALFFRRDDARALAQRIREIYEGNATLARREEISDECSRVYSIEVMADGLASAIRGA